MSWVTDRMGCSQMFPEVRLCLLQFRHIGPSREPQFFMTWLLVL